MLLALDTSTHLASLALCENGELRAEYTWDVGANHSVELLRRLEWLLQERGLSMTQISAVAVAAGPGSFTGVRVAVTVAKTLAFSLKVPLIGVSTLDVLAYSHAAAALPVCALMEAGRGEFYAALYRQSHLDSVSGTSGALAYSTGTGGWVARDLPASGSRSQDGLYWQRQGEYRVVTAEELARGIQESTLFCGDLRSDSRRKLAGVLGSFALFARSLPCTRHASLLAELALQRLERGDVDDPLTLEPLYLRRPAITVSTKQRPQLLGQPGNSGPLPDGPATASEDQSAGIAPGGHHFDADVSAAKGALNFDTQDTRLMGDLRWRGLGGKLERPSRQAPGGNTAG